MAPEERQNKGEIPSCDKSKRSSLNLIENGSLAQPSSTIEAENHLNLKVERKIKHNIQNGHIIEKKYRGDTRIWTTYTHAHHPKPLTLTE